MEKGFNKIVDFDVINESNLLAGNQPAVKHSLLLIAKKWF